MESLRRLHGRLLVFAHDDATGPEAFAPFGANASDSAVTPDELFTMLYWYNTRPFDGEVVVVRDVARWRRFAMACLPGRLPGIVSGGMSPVDDAVFRAPSITTLGRPATEGACGTGKGWAASVPARR